MRIALISDLHGNAVALEAVLADIDRIGVDRVFCLGDVAALGPDPVAVVAMLRELGCPCIAGNHDAFMLDPKLARGYTQAREVLGAIEWCREQLSAEDLRFFERFEPSLSIPLSASSTLLLVHGSPRSNTDDLLVTMPAGELDEALAGTDADVVAAGHTHVPMLRQHMGRLIVNPGSVGLAFKEYAGGGAPTLLAHADYATLDIDAGDVSVIQRRVTLDRKVLCERACAGSYPLQGMLLEQYA